MLKNLLGGALPRSHHFLALIAAIGAAGALAGCVVEQPAPTTTHVVVTRPAPPAPRAEFQPPPPNERAVWDPGRWNWNGREYVWVGGHYIERPNVAMRWEPGHWAPQGGNWVWIDGRWY